MPFFQLPHWPARRAVPWYANQHNYTSTKSAEEIATISASLARVHDYPRPGLTLLDFTTLLENPAALHLLIDILRKRYENSGVTHIVASEARGFCIGAPLAYAMRLPFVPVRKERKLPSAVVSVDIKFSAFSSERIEVHADSIPAGAKVVIVDDVVGSGATLEGMIQLMEKCGATVIECGCIAVLPGLARIRRTHALTGRLFCVVPPEDEEDRALLHRA